MHPAIIFLSEPFELVSQVYLGTSCSISVPYDNNLLPIASLLETYSRSLNGIAHRLFLRHNTTRAFFRIRALTLDISAD